jgi:hypothetical protein
MAEDYLLTAMKRRRYLFLQNLKQIGVRWRTTRNLVGFQTENTSPHSALEGLAAPSAGEKQQIFFIFFY